MGAIAKAGLVVKWEATVIRVCGCVEDHGVVAIQHTDPRQHRAVLLDRYLGWHRHAERAAAKSRVKGLAIPALEQFLKDEEIHGLFRPRPLTLCTRRDSCVSPFRGLPHPHIGGGGPVFAYAGKLITTNKLHGVAQTEPIYVGMGLGTGTHQNYDSALFNPSPEARAAGTASLVSTAAGFAAAPAITDTEKIVGTITASAARAVTEAGCFDASAAAPATTLSAAISSATATSISVSAATGFPTSGNYDIEVSDGTHPAETMTVTAGQGTTTWTVTRGARGSTAQAAINSGAN